MNTATLSGAGVMRLFNKVGETVNKITYRMDESDPVSIQFEHAFDKINAILFKHLFRLIFFIVV